jgi:hypothetical protein
VLRDGASPLNNADLHVGGVQVDRHVLAQLRRALGRQHSQRRGDITEPGLHRCPLRLGDRRANPAAVVVARPGTGADCWPAVSARWRSNPTRKSFPASFAAAIPNIRPRGLANIPS